jgi:rhodanese-related sulfurtransferase
MENKAQNEKTIVSGGTRLSVALEAIPGALDYIISLNPHDFSRLQNPFMRKYMSPRISLRRVAAMAQIPEEQLLRELATLGGAGAEYSRHQTTGASELAQSPAAPPKWMQGIEVAALHQVNVLPIDDVLGDPFIPISIAFKRLLPGGVLLLRHRWEPQPLYDIWQKIGLEWFSRQVAENEWHVFIHKPPTFPVPSPADTVILEVRHLQENEAAPRVVAVFEQIGTLQNLEITGASPAVAQQMRQAMDAQYRDQYHWEEKENAMGKPMILITSWRKSAKTITRDELKTRMERGEFFHLAETLAHSCYLHTHLPGAIHLSPDAVRRVAPVLFPDTNALIVLYCSDESCLASDVAARELEALGYRNLRVYHGGKRDWVEAGLPVEGQSRRRGALSR